MQGRTILLVEDQYLVAAVEQRDLERCGYSVLMANTGDDAITLFHAHPEIDLILMDVDLGADMDGTEAAARILRKRDLPIVFLSSHTEPEMVERTEGIASYGYVLKNSGITVLDASIKMAFRLFAKEQAVRAAHAQLSIILETHSDPIWAIDLSYTLVYGNSAHLCSLARSSEGGPKPGTNLLQALPATRQEAWKKRFDHVLNRHRLEDVEVLTDGFETTYFEIIGQPILLGEQIIGASFFARDITSNKRAEMTLQTEKNRLEHLVSCANVGTWEWDVGAGKVTVNERWAEMLGYTKQEYSTVSIDAAFQLLHPDDLDRITDKLEQHFRSETDVYECALRMRHRHGHWVWFLDNGRVISRDAQGNPEWVFGTHTDISDLKETERNLHLAVEKERTLLRELRHRSKNSLSLVSSMVTLMQAMPASAETALALETIRTRILSIAGVHDLLNTDPITPVRLDQYLGRMVLALVEASDVALDCSCEPITLPLETAGPLGLITAELITNALKHAFPHRGQSMIEVTTTQTDGVIRLEIADNGVGLPREFDLDSAKTLGLRLVRNLLNQLHGTLSVCADAGTRYNIEIPYEEAAGPPKPTDTSFKHAIVRH